MGLDEADRVWLIPAVATGGAVYVAYLAANQYPTHGAGLYTLAAEQIIAHGYGLPVTIPYYTSDGIPFAYPPLALYGVALGLDLGIGPFTLAKTVPGLVTVAYLVPTYLLARDILGSRPRATAAAMLVAVNPQLLEWHISAGGLVRAPAFLLALSSIYAGYRIFTSGSRRWLAASVVLFALTVLTHPTYTLFVVVTFVVFWVVLDRSPVGVGRGLIVGVGGIVLAAPWWGAVIETHGLRVFLAAGGTHGGIGGGMAALFGGDISPWVPVLVVLSIVLLVRGEMLLSIWLLTVAALFQQPRFSYLIGSFVVVAVAAPVIEPQLRIALDDFDAPHRGIAALLVTLGAVTGVSYLSYDMTYGSDEWTPEFVDDADVAAMEWAATETSPDATFVVLGDAAEWFPLFAHRTILIAPWGVEWESAAAFDRHLDAYENISACETKQCVERWLDRIDADPDYLYVPRGGYTIRGEYNLQRGRLEHDLVQSPEYRRLFANDGVAVFRVRDRVNQSRAGRPVSEIYRISRNAWLSPGE